MLFCAPSTWRPDVGLGSLSVVVKLIALLSLLIANASVRLHSFHLLRGKHAKEQHEVSGLLFADRVIDDAEVMEGGANRPTLYHAGEQIARGGPLFV
jgi:hypothetical protein